MTDEENDTMTIRLIRGCVVDRKAYAMGAIVETARNTARELIQAGSAEASDKKAKPPKGE